MAAATAATVYYKFTTVITYEYAVRFEFDAENFGFSH